MDNSASDCRFLASGGRISGAVIQIITIAINMLIYYPFFRADDKVKLKIEQEANQEETAQQTIKKSSDMEDIISKKLISFDSNT